MSTNIGCGEGKLRCDPWDDTIVNDGASIIDGRAATVNSYVAYMCYKAPGEIIEAASDATTHRRALLGRATASRRCCEVVGRRAGRHAGRDEREGEGALSCACVLGGGDPVVVDHKC